MNWVTCKLDQCDQNGLFSKILTTNFLWKAAQIFGDLWGVLKTSIFQFKTAGIHLGNYWKNWATFNLNIWSHWPKWKLNNFRWCRLHQKLSQIFRSRAVWPDGLNIFHNLATYNSSNLHKLHKTYAKAGSKFCQTLNIPSIVSQRFLKVCPSGKISPNLVTMIPWLYVEGRFEKVIEIGLT